MGVGAVTTAPALKLKTRVSLAMTKGKESQNDIFLNALSMSFICLASPGLALKHFCVSLRLFFHPRMSNKIS